MMDAAFFIARRIRVKGLMAMICIAISFLVMIIAVAVASGFRSEIRSSLSSVAGDVLITRPDLNVIDEERPIEMFPAYLSHIQELECVESVMPVIYRTGVVRHEGNMYGVMLKGFAGYMPSDSSSLAVSLPEDLAQKAGFAQGDRMLTYFVGDRVKVRQFNVTQIYDSYIETDNGFLIHALLQDLQRLNGWANDQVSAFEVRLDRRFQDEELIREATEEIGHMINSYSSDDEEPVVATSVQSRYSNLFGWLDLIDFNVYFILLLMTIVAGFNMISGLLIILFEHISTIGLLKSLGMKDRSIAKTFIASSSVIVSKGMAIGNLLALIFCLIQDTTHILKLDPELYFVSFVPVDVNIVSVLAADVTAFVVIMLLLLIPCLFISKVDPSETVRVS